MFWNVHSNNITAFADKLFLLQIAELFSLGLQINFLSLTKINYSF
jgi:hypothetical protein